MTDQKHAEAAVKLDEQLCFAVYGAAHAFNRTYKQLLEPLGLTYPQYLVMLALWQDDNQTVKGLGERIGLDSGTLSPLLKRLESGGRIIRRRDSQDERQVLISLTAEGAAMKPEAARVMSAIGQATGCDVAELIDLRDRLNALSCNLETDER